MGMPSIETGVLGGIIIGGIIIGSIAAMLFNRSFRVQLPQYLGFFAGKRSVPILTAFAAIFTGIAPGLIWPTIGRQIIDSRTGRRREIRPPTSRRPCTSLSSARPSFVAS